ncbi:MAG: isoprenylcysteine carboxylmethyltransferase family protein [bacterium]
MILVFDILLIVLLFGLFGIAHSFLASVKIKQKITESAGSRIAFYRLFYNIISFILFIVVYEISPKPDVIIYDLNPPFDLIIVGLQVLSFIGILWAGSFVNLKEFLGISQVIRYMKNEYDTSELDEHQQLITKGPFKFSRHPIYFFSILFIGLRPTMDLFYLVMFACLTVYFYAGSYFEEKKLAAKFGQTYIDYQKNVPRIFPIKFGK